MSQDSSISPTPSKPHSAPHPVSPIAGEGSPEASAADLKLVDESSESAMSQESDFDREGGMPSPAERQQGEDGESQRITLPLWLFALTVVLAFCVIGWQARLASELEARVAGLEQELVVKAALVDAHRSHLREIRGGVRDLSERLADLHTLVEKDPSEGRPEASSPLPDHP